MAKFKLTPIDTRLDHPAWAYSTEHRACYVGATSEREARELAALEFVIAAPVGGSRQGPGRPAVAEP